MPTPYAGNPANYPAIVNIPAGSDAPTAALFDTAFEGALDRTAWLAHNSAPVRNWQPGFAPGGSIVTAGIVWNPTFRLWQHITYNSGAGSFNAIPYSGTDQIARAAPSTQTVGSIPSAQTCGTDGVLYVAAINAGVNSSLYTLSSVGGTWSTLSSSLSAGAVSTYLALAAMGTSWALVSAASGAGNSRYLSGPSGALGSVNLLIPSQGASGGWALASNGTYVVFIARNAGSLVYKGTTTTFTSTSLTGIVGASDVPLDLTWTGTAWLLAVAVTGGTSTAFYSSPDGVSWSATGVTINNFGITQFGTNTALSRLKSIGGFLVGLAYNFSDRAGYVSYSLDGGNTWYPADVILVNGSSAFTPQLHASDSQFAMAAANSTGPWIQFSNKGFVPGVLT